MAAGPIEQSLVGVDDPKQQAGIKARAILDRLAALPANQRATYTLNGYTVQLLSVPVILNDKQGRAIGFSFRARARDAQNAILPPGLETYQFVNPPVKVPDGGIDASGHPTFTENAVQALKQILLDAIVGEALRRGYRPL